MDFLVASYQDMHRRNWTTGNLGAVIVTGDALVDHSSCGISLIGK